MAIKNNLVDRRQFLRGSFALVSCAMVPVSFVSRTDGDALNLIIEENANRTCFMAIKLMTKIFSILRRHIIRSCHKTILNML